MEENKEKSFEKKQELINAALIEFADNGYENASLNNILKAAGISKGTFYYHFENKEDLYIYIISLLVEEKKKFFLKSITPDILNNNIFDLFEILFKLGLEFALKNPNINKISERYLKEKDSDIYIKINKKFNLERNDFLENFIDKAYDKGEFNQNLPKDYIKNMILYLFTHMHEIGNISKTEDFGIAANYLIDFMKNGLSNKK